MSGESLHIQLIPIQDLPEEIRQEIYDSGGEPVPSGNKLYFARGGNCLVCHDDTYGRQLMEWMGRDESSGSGDRSMDLFFRQLLDGKTEKVREEQLKAFGVRFGQNRNVILFTTYGKAEEPLMDIFRKVAPAVQDDILVPVRYDATALIKANVTKEGDDAYEYACAAAQTLESEWGISVRAGIGNCRDQWNALAESFREAVSALETAEHFHLSGTVFRYRELLTERIVSGIPSEQRVRLKREIFREEVKSLLNQEMLETIRVFFRNDLNLSTTARQLFIHRNTLQYRLDKIRNTTGLDLRKFRDASAFNLLFSFPEE